MASAPKITILLADGDVIVRLVLGDYLRSCGFVVLEAADGAEAKAILQSGLAIAVLICEAQLAGDESGFALAQWVRRYRPAIEVLLTTTPASKAQTAACFCGRYPDAKSPADAASLAQRIRALSAERKRRSRPPSAAAPGRPRRRSST
jgi:CheY-like chemotaxis protein